MHIYSNKYITKLSKFPINKNTQVYLNGIIYNHITNVSEMIIKFSYYRWFYKSINNCIKQITKQSDNDCRTTYL